MWVQVGRQYIHWASGIVLSDDLFALRIGADFGQVAIEGFFAQSPSDMIDFDASRPDFNTDTDRDFFMTPGQAKEYGLVDEVVESLRSERKE